MTITSIRQQVKNPERVSLFVDEKYGFSFGLDELVKYGLKNGQELTAAEVKKYKKISADGKLRARALEWLLNRPHSEREFRDYLFRKKAEKGQIEALISEFTAKGYLDNAKFAAWFAELQARRGKSSRAIRTELFKKGISRELADQTFQTGALEDSEIERLRAVIAKKGKLSRYQNDRQKFMRYLVSQGFSWQLVKQELSINQPD